MSNYNPLTRRQFLRGVGGASILLPLLPSLLPRAASAQALGRAPVRYLQIIDWYGTAVGAWHPGLQDVNKPQTLDPIVQPNTQMTDGVYYRKLSDIQGPISVTFGPEFDKFKNKMSIIQGLDCLDEWAPLSATNTSGRIDAHSASIPTTGGAFKKEIKNHAFFNLSFPYSVDAVLEESRVIYPTPAALGALRVAPFQTNAHPYAEFGTFSWTSKSGAQNMILPDRDMKAVYDKLFNRPVPEPMASMGPSREKIVTDLVLEDYKAAMNGRRIAADDKIRLDNYMTFLSEASQRLGMGAPPPLSCSKVAPPGPQAAGETYETNAVDMIVAAFACGATRVGSYVPMHHHSDAGAGGTDHDAGHGSDHTPASQQAQNNRFVALRVADLMTKLDAIQEADGRTLLDNTIIYFSNEDSVGFHQHYEMPIMIAGGGGGKLRMGYHMDFRPRPLTKVEFNISAGRFQQHLGRPLNSLLVTLLQAMGLSPADYQKFGKTGFGIYDRYKSDLAAHYAPFITEAAKNQPLPFFYLG
jgi:Protein of unknown function (DUF1552)